MNARMLVHARNSSTSDESSHRPALDDFETGQLSAVNKLCEEVEPEFHLTQESCFRKL